MTATIDKLGRLVVPKLLREELNLRPGTVLDIESDAGGLRMRIPAQGSALVRKGGFVLHHGSGSAEVNIVDFIRKEREARAVRRS